MANTTRPQDNETIANLPGDIRAVTDLVTNHTEAASAAHAASAISYGSGSVDTALDTAAGHEADQNNPHGVTAAQAGAVALADAVTTATADKVVKRDSNGKVVGDITGNAATATTATTAAACTGNAATATTAAACTGNAATATKANPQRADGSQMAFNWIAQGGQPAWLWGGNDGTNMYVYNPANFNVNYAATAGSAPANGGNANSVNGFSFRASTGGYGEVKFEVYIPLTGTWATLYSTFNSA